MKTPICWYFTCSIVNTSALHEHLRECLHQLVVLSLSLFAAFKGSPVRPVLRACSGLNLLTSRTPDPCNPRREEGQDQRPVCTLGLLTMASASHHNTSTARFGSPGVSPVKGRFVTCSLNRFHVVLEGHRPPENAVIFSPFLLRQETRESGEGVGWGERGER